MRALVLWADKSSPNLGVRALGEGTSQIFRNIDPHAQVSFQSFGTGDSPVRIGLASSQLKRLLRSQDVLVDWLRGFDVVLDTRAGDSLADIYGLRRLITMSLMTELVAKAKVLSILVPQTIGPFHTWRGKKIASRTMQRPASVMARDSASAAQARLLGRPVDVLATDVVFAIQPVIARQTRDVVVNPSGLLWNTNRHVNAAAYRAMLLGVCNGLLSQGRRLSVLAHVLDSNSVDNDLPPCSWLAQQLDADVEILVPADLADARSMLSSARLVVGTRMHACLNALSVGTPAVSLAYSRKFEPLLRDLGWPYTLDLANGTTGVESVLNIIERAGDVGRVGAVRDSALELLSNAQLAIARLL